MSNSPNGKSQSDSTNWEKICTYFDYYMENTDNTLSLMRRCDDLQNQLTANKNAVSTRLIDCIYIRWMKHVAQEDLLFHLVRALYKVAKLFISGIKQVKNSIKKIISGVYRFTKQKNPEVSIIIPCHNLFKLTSDCLRTIKSASQKHTFEIIIADDASTDETKRIDSFFKGITVIHNAEAMGFLGNVNAAVHRARGHYLYLLNNDTRLCPHAIDYLVETIQADNTIGLVGSKLLFDDSTAQEAGGIILSDGSAYLYGYGQCRDDFTCNYVREVSYCSGASLLTTMKLWNDIGGFDTRYGKGYCEDSDYAFEVKSRGYKVVYQPLSEVFHFEHASYISNEKAVEINSKKLYEKWSHYLHDCACEYDKASFAFCKDNLEYRKCVIMVDDCIPCFDINAGARTTRDYIELYVELGFHVIFVAMREDASGDEPYVCLLQQKGVEVARGLDFTAQKEFLIKYKQIADYVFINRPIVAEKYLNIFNGFKAKIIYYGHDLHYLRTIREYELTGKTNVKLFKNARNYKSLELGVMEKADIVLSVSPIERDIINSELMNNKALASPIFFYAHKEVAVSMKAREGLLFVSGFLHSPNVDAVLWFVNEILPLIQKELPEIKLTIAGSYPTEEILKLESSLIHITGYLTDNELDELYEKSRVCVVPLRFGAGVKGKTVNAMYNGLPIVSTSIGIEGLPKGCPISGIDEAASFATKVVELYYDDETSRRLGEAGIDYINNYFSHERALDFWKSTFGTGVRNEK